MKKRGLSGVITTLLLVTLSLVAIAIVWVTINNLLSDQLENVESCLGISEKVELNRLYTCYNNTLDNFQFSINIKDVDVNSVVVSISGGGTTTSYTLTNSSDSISGLGPYPSGSGNVVLPGKNSGLTYVSSDFSSAPDLINIAPVVGSNRCEVSDSIVEIYSC